MAEIEASLLAKVHSAEGIHERPVLIGFLRSRKKRVGTLIEATSGQSLKELKRQVKKKGGKKIKVYKEINTLYAEMPVDKVTELASVSCAQKVYDAEGDIKPCLNESVPLVMGVEKWELPYRVKWRKIEGQGIKVAVIDSGIDKKHPDFAWRIKRVRNFSGGRKYKGTEHGTHVAGIIAGSGKVSGYRFTGVAPKVKLYVAKIFINSETPTTRNTVIEATRWAIKKKVQIINMSFGDAQGCSDGTCPLCKIADYAVEQGITVVTVTGNIGPAEGTITCPGNSKRAITVGATTKTLPILVTGFSSRGSPKQPDKPDVVAPGDKIVAPQPEGQYTAMSGTSMAAPHVSGLAALLYQSGKYVNGKRRMTSAEIKHTLKQGSIDLGEHFTAQGSGLVNFENDLTAIHQSRNWAWFPKRKKNKPQPVGQTSRPQLAEVQAATCPAVMNMFCSHYDKNLCNDIYESCIHYQAGKQAKVLRQIRILPQEVFFPPVTSQLTEMPAALPQNMGSKTLAGQVVGTIDGQPLQGVTVSVGDRTTTTDVNGVFKLQKAGKGRFAVVLSGDHIYPRSAAVKNTLTTFSVKLDAIELDGRFNLQFYRELARGWHPAERRQTPFMQPIHRWINRKAPTFYIDINTTFIRNNKFPRKAIGAIREIIQQILPVFSGNTYTKAPIKVRKFPTQNVNLRDAHYHPDFTPLSDNSIVISFNDEINSQGAYGVTYTSPEFFSPTISFINKAWIFVVTKDEIVRKYRNCPEISQEGEKISLQQIVAHELGHGFGYRHTGKSDSIMNLGLAYSFRFLPKNKLFCDDDELHMRIMYSRPVGNFDIDNDPVPASKVRKKPIGRQVFIDRWTDSAY
jgi:serine protease AprX